MRMKRFFRLNESRDSEIRKLIPIIHDKRSWVKERHLDEFFYDDEGFKNSSLLCFVINQYIMDEFLREPFFRKNADIYESDFDVDGGWFFGSIAIEPHNSEVLYLLDAFDVNRDSIDVTISIKTNYEEEPETEDIVNFNVKYTKTSTVSDVIESILDELDSYMSKIISSVKDEVLSSNKELQKRLNDIYKRISETYTEYKNLCNEFEELGGNLDNWENVGKKRIDSAL